MLSIDHLERASNWAFRSWRPITVSSDLHGGLSLVLQVLVFKLLGPHRGDQVFVFLGFEGWSALSLLGPQRVTKYFELLGPSSRWPTLLNFLGPHANAKFFELLSLSSTWPSLVSFLGLITGAYNRWSGGGQRWHERWLTRARGGGGQVRVTTTTATTVDEHPTWKQERHGLDPGLSLTLSLSTANHTGGNANYEHSPSVCTHMSN